MELRRFGWTGVPVPVLGQGTWNMETDGRREVLEALRRGLDAGLTHLDTAEMYGDGRVEELVGEAIVGRRDDVFLASKVVPANATRRGVVAACQRSLERLRTDRLDLYLLHWPGAVPFEETAAGFEQLVEQGKIRYWGVSNFDVAQLRAAVAAVGERRIACNQVLYHLEERYAERELIPWCRGAEIAVVAYSPFGSGSFPEPGSAGRRVLDAIAQAHGATAHQVALRFLLRDANLFAIPKASRAAHAGENAVASDLQLDVEELRRIDGAFPRRESERALPVL